MQNKNVRKCAKKNTAKSNLKDYAALGISWPASKCHFPPQKKKEKKEEEKKSAVAPSQQLPVTLVGRANQPYMYVCMH